jgi:hypothetical protein
MFYLFAALVILYIHNRIFRERRRKSDKSSSWPDTKKHVIIPPYFFFLLNTKCKKHVIITHVGRLAFTPCPLPFGQTNSFRNRCFVSILWRRHVAFLSLIFDILWQTYKCAWTDHKMESNRKSEWSVHWQGFLMKFHAGKWLNWLQLDTSIGIYFYEL